MKITLYLLGLYPGQWYLFPRIKRYIPWLNAVIETMYTMYTELGITRSYFFMKDINEDLLEYFLRLFSCFLYLLLKCPVASSSLWMWWVTLWRPHFFCVSISFAYFICICNYYSLMRYAYYIQYYLSDAIWTERVITLTFVCERIW